MVWNWQQTGWPAFTWDVAALQPLEQQFLLRSGESLAAVKHISLNDQHALRIEIISDEAVKTSEIEGEILNRESVQSSLRQQFGFDSDNRRITPAERGIASIMVDLYKNFAAPLTHTTMHHWHKMLLGGQFGLKTIGDYRKHPEPMQIISGPVHDPAIHFEAPPSGRMQAEMDAFVVWFNETAPDGRTPLPALTRAGIAHLYFVTIHPFEDGNGRIARALAEKSLAQNLGQPTLIALSFTIERARRAYYAALENSNKSNALDSWLHYFAQTLLEAQGNTILRIEFLIAKARLYDRLRGRLNERHEKLLARLFQEGPDGFRGGLSANNYVTITRTSRATTTRDLQDLVDMGALVKTGQLRHTRYFLNLHGQPLLRKF